MGPKIEIPDDYDDEYEYDPEASEGKYGSKTEVAEPSHAHKARHTELEKGVNKTLSTPVVSLVAGGSQASLLAVLRNVLSSMHEKFGISVPVILLGGVSFFAGTAVCCLCLCLFC